jgi:phosphoglycolate phosphatase-like HAD superfamily hydrolase
MQQHGSPHTTAPAGRDWFFDCDGVLLDSNDVKSLAFGAAVVAAGHTQAHAQALVEHHRLHAGVSRFAKFEWFFQHVLHRPPQPGELEQLLDLFGGQCRSELLRSAVEPHAAALLGVLRAAGIDAHVVSGGLQTEVQEALQVHGLAGHFRSVNGSPRDKHQILGDLGRRAAPSPGGVFVGDSRYDMEVAGAFGLRRVFVSQWTDFTDWRNYVAARPDIVVVASLEELVHIALSLDSAP